MIPVPPNDDERIATLRSYAVLDTPKEESFDALTRLAARLFGVAIALVSLVDKDHQWFKSSHGLDAEQTPRDQAFCTYAIMENEPLVVLDATLDERFSDNPLVTGAPGIRLYAGAADFTGELPPRNLLHYRYEAAREFSRFRRQPSYRFFQHDGRHP